MTNRLSEPRLRLREPVDVLAAIPYLIGYQPTDSVVALAMRGRRLYFTVRDDLPPGDAPPDLVAEAVDEMLDLVLRQRVSGVLFVAYGSEERARPVLFGLRDTFEDAGLAVLELLRADDGRYGSYICGNPDCCPPSGTPYDVHRSAVPAEATVAGCVALPDRDAYEALVRPEVGPGLASVTLATTAAGDRKRELERSGGRRAVLLAGRGAIDEAFGRQLKGERLNDDEVAWLTVLLTSHAVRDLALSRITGPPDVVEVHRALWMDVFRRAAPDHVAEPGSLFAFAAWRCGDATLARLALERVLADSPRHDLGVVMHRIVVSGLAPSVLEEFGFDQIRQRFGGRRRRRSSSRRAGSRQA
jgi:hypothetical protein